MKSFIVAYVLRTTKHDHLSKEVHSDTDHYQVFCEYDELERTPEQQAENFVRELENSFDEGSVELYSWNVAEITKTSEHYPIQRFDTQINLYLPLEKLLGRKIIGFEIAPVIEVADDCFEKVDETDLDENELFCWSVYVRVEAEDFNPVDCIADFPTKEDAEKFEDILRKLFL